MSVVEILLSYSSDILLWVVQFMKLVDFLTKPTAKVIGVADKSSHNDQIVQKENSIIGSMIILEGVTFELGHVSLTGWAFDRALVGVSSQTSFIYQYAKEYLYEKL